MELFLGCNRVLDNSLYIAKLYSRSLREDSHTLIVALTVQMGLYVDRSNLGRTYALLQVCGKNQVKCFVCKLDIASSKENNRLTLTSKCKLVSI